MKKERIIFTIIILIFILAAFVLTKVFTDLKKESRIKDEIKEVVKVLGTENIEDDDVNEILERRIFSRGNYFEVEDSIKNYFKDLYNYQKNINFLMDEDNFSNYLSGANLNEDKTQFTKSIANLQTTKSQLTDKYTEFDNQLSSDSIKMSYIVNKDIKTYYKKFYLDLIDEYIPTDLKDNMQEKYENTLEKIDLYSDAFAFLTANAAHWTITDEVLTFDDTTLYDSYKAITDQIDDLKETNKQAS